MIAGKITTEALAVLTRMVWTRRNPWYVESGCGRYVVSKARVVAENRYTAWRRHDGMASDCLGVYPTSDAAKAACEEHANP